MMRFSVVNVCNIKILTLLMTKRGADIKYERVTREERPETPQTRSDI